MNWRYTFLIIVFVSVALSSCSSHHGHTARLDKSFDATPDRQYNFDYIMMYDFYASEKDTVPKPIYVLTNSKKANYFIEVSEKDRLNYTVDFVDQDKIFFVGEVAKDAFFMVKSFQLSCDQININRNYWKSQTDNYSFKVLTDTLIYDEKYKRYKLYDIESNKRGKRLIRKTGDNYYVIENDTEFHMPILRHGTAYEEYKKEKNVPNGIFREMYWVQNGTDVKSNLYRLREYRKTNLSIFIEEGCDFYTAKNDKDH